MFIELVEVLRCIREHDESWLVASIDEMRERSIIEGTLGCPVCGAEYPIARGVVDFSAGNPAPSGGRSEDSPDEIAMRAGGLLNLGESTGIVVLGGNWGRGAPSLAAMATVRVIVVNPTAQLEESGSVAIVRAAAAFPLGTGSCAGIALDDSFSGAALSSAMRCLAPGGRIVAPVKLEPPPSAGVLARDERYWVGEKAREVTSLRRGNR